MKYYYFERFLSKAVTARRFHIKTNTKLISSNKKTEQNAPEIVYNKNEVYYASGSSL